MRCPHCHAPSTPVENRCASCGFKLSDISDTLAQLPARAETLFESAQVLSPKGRSLIQSRLNTFSRLSGHDTLVATISTSAPLQPSEYAFALFERWRIGGAQRDGLLILFTQEEMHLECVLGAALSPLIAPAMIDALFERHALPHMRRQDIDKGIYNALDLVLRVFEHAEGLR